MIKKIGIILVLLSLICFNIYFFDKLLTVDFNLMLKASVVFFALGINVLIVHVLWGVWKTKDKYEEVQQ